MVSDMKFFNWGDSKKDRALAAGAIEADKLKAGTIQIDREEFIRQMAELKHGDFEGQYLTTPWNTTVVNGADPLVPKGTTISLDPDPWKTALGTIASGLGTSVETWSDLIRKEQLARENLELERQRQKRQEEAEARQRELQQRQFLSVQFVARAAPDYLDTAASRRIDNYLTDTPVYHGSALTEDLIGLLHKTGMFEDDYHPNRVRRIEQLASKWGEKDHERLVARVHELTGHAAKIQAVELRQSDLDALLDQMELDEANLPGGEW
jgi:hypothetical protein